MREDRADALTVTNVVVYVVVVVDARVIIPDRQRIGPNSGFLPYQALVDVCK